MDHCIKTSKFLVLDSVTTENENIRVWTLLRGIINAK